MSMRAPCLSEAVAKAYADPHCSSSASTSALSRPPLSFRRKRRHYSTMHTMAASLLLLLLALPIASAIFDPGQSDVVEEPSIPKVVTVPVPPRLSSSGDSRLSLVAPKGQPISLHPGCKRTSDLFDNVCHNPWSPFSSSHRKSHAASHSELVICPVGEVGGDNGKERVFAITGTITLPESTYADVEAASSSPVGSVTLGDKEAYWPKPGDEGFWRQRDGELEWVPTEVRALLESDRLESGATPATTAKVESVKEEGTAVPDVAHAEEYHAWSESVGGEDSKTWLSFEQWRENHLAAEREQEKQRIALGRKQKNDKAKEKKVAQGQAGNATEKSAESHTQGTSENVNATKIAGGTPDAAITSTISEAKQERPAEDHQASLDEKVDGKQSPESPAEATKEDPVEPSIVKADSSQDTHAIPAIGDASTQLSTLKHRWNFASFDCAAVVHRANPSAKFTSSILSEKKDRYMLSPCPQNANDPQFVVVELCDEISVDTIVLANYEFFSRMFKRFRVRVARNLNGGEADWYDIGTFRARNVRGLQVFNTVPPTADSRFFRYVRIDFLEHYGSEYYCPVSLLRVYGLTQMDDYIREEEELRRQKEAELTLAESESAEDEEDKEEEAKEGEVEATSTVAIETQQVEAKKTGSSDEGSQSSSSVESPTSPQPTSIAAITSIVSSEQPSATVEKLTETTSTFTSVQSTPSHSAHFNTTEKMNATELANETSNTLLEGAEGALSKPVIDLEKAYRNTSTTQQSNQVANSSAVNATSQSQASLTNATETASSRSSSNSSSEPLSALPVNATASGSPVGEAKERASNVTNSPPPAAPPTSSSEANKPAAGNGQQQQNAGGSESIYRTITKRLNTLEANATLSIQYMEHSRQQLGEVFGRMERNQREKIAEMLKELNASNWRQIESLKRRQQVDLQQAIFEFDKHRQQTDAERRQLLAQVHILSNEVILEKRFGIAQLVLLLGLFVFMALTRGSRAAPLIHQGIARISSKASSATQQAVPASPFGSVRKTPGLQRHIDYDARRMPSPSPIRQIQSARPFSMTPRLDRYGRGLERAVPLRGGSHSKSLSSVKKGRSIGVMPFSPISVRDSVTSISSMASLQRSSDSASSSLQDHSSSSIQTSPILRPMINLDTSHILAESELETPVHRARSRTSTFQREDTPTNLFEARRMDLGSLPPPPPPPVPLAASTLGDSYGSDWGTERSDDEESHTSYDLHNKGIIIGEAETPPSITPIPPSSPPHPHLTSSIQQIEESDAEEDSPKWNSVKSRRSLKRPNSSGNSDWQPHLNGNARVHTPPNHLIHTPTRRSFSPFHKNAEIEIN